MNWVFEDDYKIIIPKRNASRPILQGGDLFSAMFDHYLFETYHHIDIFKDLVEHISNQISGDERTIKGKSDGITVEKQSERLSLAQLNIFSLLTAIIIIETSIK